MFLPGADNFRFLEVKRMMNLVALPCLCVDVFDGTDELRAGGEALNFAVHASKFEEFNVSILGAVGQDSYAKFIMDSVSDKRIDVSHVRVEEDKVTANNRTYLTADGDRYYKDDSWTGDIVDKMILNQDELDFIKKSEVVFIHFWAGCFEQIIDLKKNNNFRLAVDFVEYRNFKEMEKYAPYIDYFLISGEESILPIFEAFSKKYKGLFNASLADKGSVTYYNGEKYFVPADEALEIVDTTGCGDSYHAGFVCSHMLIGDIYEAMRVGTGFATETLSHYGGF